MDGDPRPKRATSRCDNSLHYPLKVYNKPQDMIDLNDNAEVMC